MPLDDGIRAYLYGSATGMWNVNWITFWGVMLFNTLVTTGVFEKFRRWLIAQGTAVGEGEILWQREPRGTSYTRPNSDPWVPDGGSAPSPVAPV